MQGESRGLRAEEMTEEEYGKLMDEMLKHSPSYMKKRCNSSYQKYFAQKRM